MADAIGTQTEALVIRGLSVGVEIRRVARLGWRPARSSGW
jgi:magnesium transporter